MKTLILTQSDVTRLLSMRECMDVMAETLAALARGEAVLPLRQVLRVPENRGAMALMPSYLGGSNSLGAKIISVFNSNWGTQYDSHQGVVLLFEAEHGCLQAILDASSITAIRTAAVSGVATRLLAREDAGNLAVLGTGSQASTHIGAMIAARNIRRIRVWSRSPEHARKFAEAESRRHGISIEPANSAREAVVDADLICTTTSAKEPVLEGAWIKNGAHINAVGACTPATRELDTMAVVRSSLYTDRRESLLNEAGDFLIPWKEGAVAERHLLGEIGEILTGEIAGRSSVTEITLFKSLGIAVEDLACARFLYEKALREGAGTPIEIGGTRHDI